MVIDKSVKGYKCPYCGHFYRHFNDAMSCAEECADVESPEDETLEMFQCEMCGKESEREDEMNECEAEHKERNDVHYMEYIYKKEMEKLIEASKHPSQKKLKDTI